MGFSIRGAPPKPYGYQTWEEWAAQLADFLELQGEDLTSVVTSFNTGDMTLDSSGRLRVSQSLPILETYFESNSEDRIWDTHTAGTGTFTYNTTARNITLSTGGAGSGARAMRQLKTYLRFRRGMSTLVNINYTPSIGTFTGAAKTRAGYFDDTDGIYFQVSATGSAVVFRGSGTGVTLETVVPQASWNLDKLNGGGASRVTLDVTLPQALIIDFSTLNIGRIRFGFRFDSEIVYFHQSISYNGTSPAAFVRRALPVRLEAINDGGTGSTVSLKHGGMSVLEEGGLPSEESGYLSTATTAAALKLVADSTTLTPVLSIRLKDTFGGLDVHGLVKIEKLTIFNSSNNPVYYELLEDGITLTGAAFTSIGSESIVEQDIASSSYTGGNKVLSGFVNSGTGSGTLSSVDIIDQSIKPNLGRLYTTNTRPPILLACRGIGGSANIGCSMLLKEYF